MVNNTQIIIDTGPIIAYFNRNDNFHEWVKIQFAKIIPPLITCESVLSEACFLLRKMKHGQKALLEALNRGLFMFPLVLSQEAKAILQLMTRYDNVPISLADACLVRLSEHYHESQILTLDKDFKIYRRNGRQVIPTIMPVS